VFVVASLAIVSVLGLGFAAGGLAVLYKRINTWLNLLQFGFLVLISAPAFDLGWTKFLPLAQGSAMLQRAMIDGTRLWEFSPVDLAVLVGVAVGYILLGYASFTTRPDGPGGWACSAFTDTADCNSMPLLLKTFPIMVI
jgi:ABC-2 type transport system permease protein